MIPFLLTLSLAASPEPPTPDESNNVPAAVRLKAMYATVRVTNQGADTRFGSGVTIGVIDGYAYVLTASHVISKDGDRRVEFFTKESFPDPEKSITTLPSDITVLVSMPTPDFALLKVSLPKKEGTRPPVAPLAPVLDRPKRFPVKVYAVGCSNGGEGPPTVTVTTLIGKKLFKRSASDTAIFWETELTHEKGRSGGPLFDQDGRVIGICAANQLDVNHGYFTYLDEIQAWMTKNGHDRLLDFGSGK